jgi:hypothetical protein
MRRKAERKRVSKTPVLDVTIPDMLDLLFPAWTPDA